MNHCEAVCSPHLLTLMPVFVAQFTVRCLMIHCPPPAIYTCFSSLLPPSFPFLLIIITLRLLPHIQTTTSPRLSPDHGLAQPQKISPGRLPRTTRCDRCITFHRAASLQPCKDTPMKRCIRTRFGLSASPHRSKHGSPACVPPLPTPSLSLLTFAAV